MEISAIIFDLDGTLWDCSAETAAAMSEVYKSLGIQKRVSQEFICSISGKPWSDFEAALLETVPTDRCDEVTRLLREADSVAARNAASDVLYPGVQAGLAILRDHYPLFVVSNCGTDYLDAFLQRSGVGHCFVDAECWGRTGLSKAENIRAVVNRQKLRAPCYIGDTAGDEESAHLAGLPFFHAAYGFGHPRNRCESFPDFPALCSYFLERHGQRN